MIDRTGANRTAEDYRQLRTNLQFLNVDEPPKVIMISAPCRRRARPRRSSTWRSRLADAGPHG